MKIDESTLFGQIAMALVNGWTPDHLRVLTNSIRVSAVYWGKATRENRSEVINQLVDMLWMSAAQQRLMIVAMGRVRLALSEPDSEGPLHMLPVVTDRMTFPSTLPYEVVFLLRAYAMPPAATDLNI
jgi:hypothetical protein